MQQPMHRKVAGDASAATAAVEDFKSPSSRSLSHSRAGAQKVVPVSAVAAGAPPPASLGSNKRSKSPATARKPVMNLSCPGGKGVIDGNDKEALGVEDGEGDGEQEANPLSWQERLNMALLVLLYALQGIPLGLTTGSLPFMLQHKLSFTQVGIFSLSAYPYSLKLLWSPIVDSCFSPRLGRRKSWILPVQLAIAMVLVVCAGRIQDMYEAADVLGLTWTFVGVVFLAATQDIAVDGWALTLLSPANVGYASTCQTIGLNFGYFTSFTVFLAITNGEFCDTYLRSWPGVRWLLPGLGLPGSKLPLVSLAGYLRFWGWAFTLVTLLIAFIPELNFSAAEEKARERRRDEDHLGQHMDQGQALEGGPPGLAATAICTADAAVEAAAHHRRRTNRPAPLSATLPRPGTSSSLKGRDARSSSSSLSSKLAAMLSKKSPVWVKEVAGAYLELWGVCQLPAVWALGAFLLTYRLGVMPTEGAYSLKLIDKGVAKESLAFLVLFQFPIEMGAALLAGRWAATHSPSAPFITGYFLRLVICPFLLVLTDWFPPGASSLSEHAGPFALLAAASLLQSFACTLTFTAIGSFFNRISDPAMGGAYLTLLNTIANMGYMIPKTPVFALIDRLTIARCSGYPSLDYSCPKKLKDMLDPSACIEAGGTCSLASDGFYIVSWACLILGALIGVVLVRTLPKLMALPLSSWRATNPNREAAKPREV